MTMIYGAAIGPNGAAVVGAEHDDSGVLVTEFRTFAPVLAPVGDAILELPDSAAVYVDGGLHGADLWVYLGGKKTPKHIRLFETARPELRRAELVGPLRVAYERRTFRIRSSIPEVAALETALKSATREDGHERVEVAALSLAVVDRRRKKQPLYVGTVDGLDPNAGDPRNRPGVRMLIG